VARYEIADLARHLRCSLRTRGSLCCDVVLSCDPAGKAGIKNDYTAMTVVGIDAKEMYLLHVDRPTVPKSTPADCPACVADSGSGSAVAGISDLFKHPLEYKKAPQPHAELLASD
jgi:hypothetical protein